MTHPRSVRRVVAEIVVLALLTAGCASSNDTLLLEGPGGEATTPLNNELSFASPAPTLSDVERASFEIGETFFDEPWLPAPSDAGDRDGLGPLFNADSCAACHVLDGRGTAPSSGGLEAPGLILMARSDATGLTPHPWYGSQIQDRALTGIEPEGRVIVEHSIIEGQFADGTRYELRAPRYRIGEPAHGVPADIVLSPRLAPIVAGAGLIEAIPEASILALADPDDADRDGISGRPNMVSDPTGGSPAVGRFGWKAAIPTVRAQVASAFRDDIGITTPDLPEQPCTPEQLACLAAPNGGSPELTDERLAFVVQYAQTLAIPERRELDEPHVIAGADLFARLGCDSCHTPTFITGDHPIEALSGQRITPFSDFLLHDMGPLLADGFASGNARPTEWRTAPLWGIGLAVEVNGRTGFMHDGRARTLEEAVLWHGGEAAPSKTGYEQLDAADRARVIAFLESL